MIRLFVGLELPEHIQEQVYNLRGGIPNTRWMNKENLHLSLRFIGQVEETDANYIHDYLSQVNFHSFDLALTQVGLFTQGNQPKHMWVGVDNYHVLDELTLRVESAVQRAGQSSISRKFHAHTTIAKFRGASWDKIQEFISFHNLFKSEPFRVNHFTLFSSHPHHNGVGSFYRVEARYELNQD